MATILVFRAEGRTPESGVNSRRERQARPAAEIIFFPGVRYEREVDPGLPAHAAGRAPGIERDRLQLIE